MLRLLFRSILLFAVLLAVVTGFAYWQLLGSLPLLDGELALAGIGNRVEVERDAAGIPTISAGDRRDLAFATGFVHGQERFFQMDLSRRRAAGELAALFGNVAVKLDAATRVHRFRARARDVIDASSDHDRALLHAYAAGVNAALAELRAQPFEYYILRQEAQPWTPEDSILVGYAMFLTLNDERAMREIQRGYVHRAYPAAVFEWLYPRGSAWDAPLQGTRTAPQTLPGPSLLDIRGRDVVAGHPDRSFDTDDYMPGSNSWAVSGSLTENGAAIVASDMHLSITAPNIFYRARFVIAGERDISGLTLPGTPVMVAGSNGSVAWSFTNSQGDWSDAVIVRPAAGNDSYLTPDGPEKYRAFDETIEVADAAPQRITVRETRWGPVLDDVYWPDGEIAVRWIAHDSTGVNIAQLGLETAATLDEALDIANRMGIPPQNFVAGDAAGNIGWTIAGRIPRRADFDPWLPADWSSSGGWEGWLAPEAYPRIVNPESGRIWTANARVIGAPDPGAIGDGGYALGARAAQIRDALFEREQFQVGDMLDIQLDDRALFLERWRRLILRTLGDRNLSGSPDRREFRRLVQAWIPRASVDSVGYRLVREFRVEVRDRVFGMLLAPVQENLGDEIRLRISNQFERPLWQLLDSRPRHLLSAEYPTWQALLLAAIDANIERYKTEFGGDMSRRTWGERNMADIRHPLSPALPALAGWLDMPREPLAGDNNMPRAQGPDFGASERFGVAPGGEAGSYLHMPAGQSGHPLSEYYRAGHEDWVRGRPSTFLPGAARYRLTLRPAT
ncbi:MAG: penicillin acylase family protein [Gammaproteobacteria bacterium]|nr:penicillin acylase family protein [Gammaproteobacteria bacterium]